MVLLHLPLSELLVFEMSVRHTQWLERLHLCPVNYVSLDNRISASNSTQDYHQVRNRGSSVEKATVTISIIPLLRVVRAQSRDGENLSKKKHQYHCVLRDANSLHPSRLL